MKILERYLLKEFLKTFLLLTGGVSTIIALFSLIEVYPEISGHNPSIKRLVIYSIINIPGFLGYILPTSTLLSSVFIIAKASKEKELLAMMSSGIDLRELMKRIMYSGIIITILGMVVMNLLMPVAKMKVRTIIEDIKKEPLKKTILTEGGFYLLDKEGNIINVELYDSETGISKGVNIFKIKKGRILNRIYAKEGKEIEVNKRYSWLLSDVYIYDFEKGIINHYESLDTEIWEETKSILRTTTNTDEMDTIRLYNYITALRKAGLGTTRLNGEIGIRLSFPFITIGFIFIGISLPLIVRMHGLVAGGIAIGMSIIYWFFLSFMMSLGYSGVINPFLAPWIPPVIFNIVGIYLYKKRLLT